MFCHFNNKAILITGASSGLGRATSILLSQLGARVCLIGRDESRLNETLEQMKGKAHMVAICDLNQFEQYPEIIESIFNRMGSISGFAHFAGIRYILPLRVLKIEKLDELMRTNVYAFVELARLLTSKKLYLDENHCSFIGVSSVSALRGASAMTGYSGTKAALEGIIKSLSIELASRHIRVNCIAPGHVDTPMNQKIARQLTEEQITAIIKAHPLGIGQPSDIANLAAFLLADESKWITGVTIPIDGGFLARQ